MNTCDHRGDRDETCSGRNFGHVKGRAGRRTALVLRSVRHQRRGCGRPKNLMTSLGRVIMGDNYTQEDVLRCARLIRRKETLLGIFKMSSELNRALRLQLGRAWTCASLVVPPIALPMACWLLGYEHREAFTGTTMIVTDRGVYRHVADQTVDKICAARHSEETLCADFIGPPTGSRSGVLDLLRIDVLNATVWHSCPCSPDVHVVEMQTVPNSAGSRSTVRIFVEHEEEAGELLRLLNRSIQNAKDGKPLLAENSVPLGTLTK